MCERRIWESPTDRRNRPESPESPESGFSDHGDPARLRRLRRSCTTIKNVLHFGAVSSILEPVPHSLISHLSRTEQRELLDDLNYLNTTEVKAFCKKHSIPYAVFAETAEGGSRRTREEDRKGVMLDRVRHFLTTGAIRPKTCFPASVVSFDAQSDHLAAGDRLLYGQYSKTNRAMMAVLKDLTDGKFKDGALARILARDFWSRGEAPTLEAFASAWIRATREHTRPNPEWAFLSDRANKTAGADWKSLRNKKAKRVLQILSKNTAAKP